jgi:hypothetical protein
VFIHFEFDDWEPGLMKKVNNNLWESYRRIPPGKHLYFLTVSGKAEFALDQPKVSFKTPIYKTVTYQVQDDYDEERKQ